MILRAPLRPICWSRYRNLLTPPYVSGHIYEGIATRVEGDKVIHLERCITCHKSDSVWHSREMMDIWPCCAELDEFEKTPELALVKQMHAALPKGITLRFKDVDIDLVDGELTIAGTSHSRSVKKSQEEPPMREQP